MTGGLLKEYNRNLTTKEEKNLIYFSKNKIITKTLKRKFGSGVEDVDEHIPTWFAYSDLLIKDW